MTYGAFREEWVHCTLTPKPTSRDRQRWYNRRMAERGRLYRTEGIVLRRQNLGEADRLLTILSPAYGKIKIIAKGVRRPRSRKAGHLEPFTRVQLLAARGRDLDIVTQVEAIETYPALKADLHLIAEAGFVAEVADRLALPGEAHPGLYRLVVHTLQRLERGEKVAEARRFFEQRALKVAGFRPQLFHCVACGAEIRPEHQFFSHAQGGVLCPNCGGERRDAEPLSLGALKVMRHYQRNTFEAASQAEIQPQTHAEVRRLMEAFFAAVLETRLNTPRFVRETAKRQR